jgi:nucleoside-specific outer membrane channel protein Tsx
MGDIWAQRRLMSIGDDLNVGIVTELQVNMFQEEEKIEQRVDDWTQTV